MCRNYHKVRQLSSFEDDLAGIISDNVSGSTDIARNILFFFTKYSTYDPDEMREAYETVYERLSGMGLVRNVCLRMLDAYEKGISVVEAAYELNQVIDREKDQSISMVREVMGDGVSIVTLSRSSQVKKAILENIELIRQVYILESRPKSEGILLHNELSEKGVDSVVLTDAEMATAAEKSDICLIGSDSVLSDNTVIHKAGSIPLFTLMRELGKKRYVLTTSLKAEMQYDFFTYPAFQHHPCNEIAPDLEDCYNVYFEKISPDLISALITDEGIIELND